MIEPTETEAKETLDAFVEAMLQIAREARDDPELLTSAPHGRPVGRLDEVRAAKQPIVRHRFDASTSTAGSRQAASSKLRKAFLESRAVWERTQAGLVFACKGGNHRPKTKE